MQAQQSLRAVIEMPANPIERGVLYKVLTLVAMQAAVAQLDELALSWQGIKG